MKTVANEIFGIFEKFKKGECTYDKALEDASKVINKYADQKPIVGYVKSGLLKETLNEVVKNKKQHTEKKYTYNCEVSHGIMDNIERMFNSI